MPTNNLLSHRANHNANYGYTYTEVANGIRQREWEAAQAQVVVTERRLSNHQAAVHNSRRRLADLRDTYTTQGRDLEHQLAGQRLELRRRQRLGQTIIRV